MILLQSLTLTHLTFASFDVCALRFESLFLVRCPSLWQTELYKLQLHTVKIGDKDWLDKEQTGVKELFTKYQPFHMLDLLLK